MIKRRFMPGVAKRAIGAYRPLVRVMRGGKLARARDSADPSDLSLTMTFVDLPEQDAPVRARTIAADGAPAVLQVAPEPSLEELVAYRRRLVHAREVGSPRIIYNGSSHHAALLIEQLFLAAADRVKIVCTSLSTQSYGNTATMKAAEQFLSNADAKLDIFTDGVEMVGGVNPFVQAFAGRDGVSVKKFKVPVDFDFMVVDGLAYRYEPDALDHAATASFNGLSLAQKLENIFDSVRKLVDQDVIKAEVIRPATA